MITQLSLENKMAPTFEEEVRQELASFEASMLSHLGHCDRVRNLRERAKDKKLPAALSEALGTAWGEVLAPAVHSRLELLAKCSIPLSPGGAEIVQRARSERERAAAEAGERGKVEEMRLEQIREASKRDRHRLPGTPFSTQAAGIGDVTHVELEPETYREISTVKDTRW